MNARYSFYSLETGLFSTKRIVCDCDDDALLRLNTPEGHRAIKGHFDPLSQRVSIERESDEDTGAIIEVHRVVDYQPPQPSPNHEWNADRKRWQLNAAARTAEAADRHARAELAKLDDDLIRPLGELAIDPNNTDALMRIDAINTRKVELRAKLKPR